MPSFKDIIGQRRSLRILKVFLKKRTMPHSLLFEGDSGLGKRKAAEVFAGAVLCRCDRPERTEACGHCIACQKMAGKNHPDFVVLEPDGNAIKIDQIRKMQEGLFYKPVDGRKKIVIIDPAEKMNPAAANALLKILEEPPPYAILILVSGKSGMLLSTLRSRCQKISFHPLSFSHVVEVLITEKGYSEAEARFVAAMANGQLRQALDLDIEAAREMESSHHILVSDADLFETAAQFSGSADVFEPALLYLMTWLRDVLVIKSCAGGSPCDPALLRYAWRQDEMTRWAGSFDRSEIHMFLSDLQRIDVAQARNVNRQLSLETFLMRLRKNQAIQSA